MHYVYLSSLIVDSDVELDDVGVLQSQKNNHELTVKILRINKTKSLKPDHVVEFDIHKTGDRYDFKVCDRCFKHLNTADHFQDNRHKKGNVITKRPSCKSCRKIKDGVAIPATVKRKWEATRPKNYTSFTCPICNKTTIVGISKIVLDHNHLTGDVRGWLCESCNTGIGRFDDDPQIAQRAIIWLEKEN